MLASNIVTAISAVVKPLYDFFGPKLIATVVQVYHVLKETYELMSPEAPEVDANMDVDVEGANVKGVKGVKGIKVKRTKEEILKFVIFKQRGRKITDVINITKGGPAVEEAADAASKWLNKA